jgi:hypothetical protein
MRFNELENNQNEAISKKVQLNNQHTLFANCPKATKKKTYSCFNF